MACKPPNWNEIIDEDDDDEHWADPWVPTGGKRRPRDGNDTDEGEGEEDMQGGKTWTRKGLATKDGKG